MRVSIPYWMRGGISQQGWGKGWGT